MPAWTSNRLALSLRKRMPERLRYYARLGQHLFRRGQHSVHIPPELLADCRFASSRFELVKNLPRRARICEVGTYRGIFARHILDACDPAELHLIDIDFALLDPSVARDPRVTLHLGRSHDMLATFPDAHFDWIYIDGDHSFDGASRDARDAAAKVKPGGHVVFNDFAHADPYLGAYGVHRAVTDFAAASGWKFVWFAYEPNALYDVALQRPL